LNLRIISPHFWSQALGTGLEGFGNKDWIQFQFQRVRVRRIIFSLKFILKGCYSGSIIGALHGFEVRCAMLVHYTCVHARKILLRKLFRNFSNFVKGLGYKINLMFEQGLIQFDFILLQFDFEQIMGYRIYFENCQVIGHRIVFKSNNHLFWLVLTEIELKLNLISDEGLWVNNIWSGFNSGGFEVKQYFSQIYSARGAMECNWVHWVWGETIFLSNLFHGVGHYRWENIVWKLR